MVLGSNLTPRLLLGVCMSPHTLSSAPIWRENFDKSFAKAAIRGNCYKDNGIIWWCPSLQPNLISSMLPFSQTGNLVQKKWDALKSVCGSTWHAMLLSVGLDDTQHVKMRQGSIMGDQMDTDRLQQSNTGTELKHVVTWRKVDVRTWSSMETDSEKLSSKHFTVLG